MESNIEPTIFKFKAFRGHRGKNGKHTFNNLIKQEFIGKTFIFESTSERLRFVFSVFKRDQPIERYDAMTIRHTLNQQKFSRAEIHAVLFNLGFRYKYVSSSFDHTLRNLKVDGYIIPNRKPGRKQKGENYEA
jgi:hypothetical protein